MSAQPKLDIVIPVYNEGPQIVQVLEALRQAVETPFRVLICYDDERDTTLAALRAYEPAFEIRLIRNPSAGPHAAIRAGFAASTAPAVLVFLADDLVNAPIVDRMVRLLDGGCEMVCPSRFVPGGCMVGCRFTKALLARVSAATLYWIARLPCHDATNGFRLFSRRVLDTLPIESSLGFTYSVELLVKCHRLGWKIGEVPAQWFERTRGESRFRVLAWLPAYVRWYGYAFATTYGFRRTVARLPEPSDAPAEPVTAGTPS